MSSHLIRSDLIPIVIGFVLIMGVLAAGLLALRRLPPGTDPRALSMIATKPGRGWLRLLRLMLGTALGGYLLLMAIVILYYFGVARVAGRFLESAVTGCALLLAISLPLFAVASWLLELWRRRGEQGKDSQASQAAPPG